MPRESFVHFERQAGALLLFPADPCEGLVFIFVEGCATPFSRAYVFSKFVTNFLFGYGLRLKALLCFETLVFTEVRRFSLRGCGVAPLFSFLSLTVAIFLCRPSLWEALGSFCSCSHYPGLRAGRFEGWEEGGGQHLLGPLYKARQCARCFCMCVAFRPHGSSCRTRLREVKGPAQDWPAPG